MKKILIKGAISGLIMGFALFIIGAITARLIYGSEMAPDGKFEPEQINVWYFLWTKLVIGVFFGIIFTWIYSKFYSLFNFPNVLKGLIYSFLLWLIISMWDISHPLFYNNNFLNTDRIFWTIYTLGGFLVYGIFVGLFYHE